MPFTLVLRIALRALRRNTLRTVLSMLGISIGVGAFICSVAVGQGASQQKDNLCGPFHAARILRDAGVTEWEGEPLDQDLVAWRTGTLLPVREHGPQVPPGAINWRDYRYELERVDDEHTGTDARPLARAVLNRNATR